MVIEISTYVARSAAASAATLQHTAHTLYQKASARNTSSRVNQEARWEGKQSEFYSVLRDIRADMICGCRMPVAWSTTFVVVETGAVWRQLTVVMCGSALKIRRARLFSLLAERDRRDYPICRVPFTVRTIGVCYVLPSRSTSVIGG